MWYDRNINFFTIIYIFFKNIFKHKIIFKKYYCGFLHLDFIFNTIIKQNHFSLLPYH